MDIRSSLDGLKTLLGVTPPAPPVAHSKSDAAPGMSGLGRDQATLSAAGSEVSLAAADSGVRTEKVNSIQAALSAGTYSVPAEAVASKVVDSMLGSER